MTKTPANPKDKCTSCAILSVAPCPILDFAYRLGYEGMEKCEMQVLVDKLLAITRTNTRLSHPRPSRDDVV